MRLLKGFYLIMKTSSCVRSMIVAFNPATALSVVTCKVIDLFSSQPKLQSFIDNALIPLVDGLKNQPGIGSYEIINEVIV